MSRSPSVFAAIVLATLSAGCPGTIDDPARFADDAAPAPDDTTPATAPTADAGTSTGTDAAHAGCPDVPAIFHDTCASSGCHSSASHSQGLDLQSPDVAARLVGVPANGGGLLIDPAAPDKSVIYAKLTASPPFGSQMPLGKPALDAATLACVLSWVSAQAGSADAGAD